MRYWVARAKPALNEPFADWLIPERIGRWWTKRPPRTWDTGDRLFLWASSPQRQIIALGELAGLQTAPDEEGFYRYRLRYLTGVLPQPVERATLSSDPVLSRSILLKYGPSTSVVRLTDDEGEQLYRLVVAQNPETDSVWPELLGRETPQALSLPDVDLTGKEGLRVLRSYLQVERDRSLVAAKKAAVLIATRRLACEVCTFDFFERYGDRGKEFCEVHHLRPLASGGFRQTALDDLAVVCSNCHRMMHRSDRVLSVEELRGYLKATPNNSMQSDRGPRAALSECEPIRLGRGG